MFKFVTIINIFVEYRRFLYNYCVLASMSVFEFYKNIINVSVISTAE